MTPSDLTALVDAAITEATEPPTASTCDDPGCARHSGTASFPHFPTARRSGADFGEAVANAWYRSCGSNRMDIPAGIVAALALWPVKSDGAAHADTLAGYIAAQPPRVLVKGYADCAASHWMLRPDLMDTAYALFRWTGEDLDDTVLRGVAAVTQAALRHGVLQYTGDHDPYHRSSIDLMSWTITNLRHHSSRKGLGEHHTPPDITALMSSVVGDFSTPPAPGSWFAEPTAGTGGFFRSMAQHLRDHQCNPHDYGWAMQELDPLAAASAAVNAIVWDLGPRAVVACGDILAQGDLHPRSLAHQRDLIRHRNWIRDVTKVAVVTRTSERLLQAVSPDTA
jgi:hypothetical protein